MSRTRTALQRALTALGGARVGRWLHRRALFVLTYHSVVDVDEAVLERAPLVYRNSVTSAQFRQQLRYLHRYHRVLDGPTLINALAGRIPWPERAVVLTFDDGLRNNASVAAPILAATGTPALFFLPTGFLDAAEAGTQRIHWTEHLAAQITFGGTEARRAIADLCPEVDPAASEEALMRGAIRTLKRLPPEARARRLEALPPFTVDALALPADRHGTSVLHTMTWQEARALPDLILLGAHGASHTSLPSLPAEAAEAEVAESQARVEAETGQRCSLFAYPYGGVEDVSTAFSSVFERLGLEGVFTQWPGINVPDTPRFSLRRINVPGLPTLGAFQYHASGLHALRHSRS